jgi:hypothetical protein
MKLVIGTPIAPLIRKQIVPLNSYTEICNLFRQPYPIVVNEEHIKRLRALTFAQTETHADSCILEIDLEMKGLGDKPTDIAHDIQFGSILPDLKEIHATYHNIKTQSKFNWHKKCYDEGLVTDFMPFKVINRDRQKEFADRYVYNVGDLLIIKVFEITNCIKYLKRKSFSMREDCYVYVQPMQNLV